MEASNQGPGTSYYTTFFDLYPVMLGWYIGLRVQSRMSVESHPAPHPKQITLIGLIA